MKKILIIHSIYSKKGGEDIAVENEIELLKTKYDVEVVYFENKIQNIIDLFYLVTQNNLKSVNKVKEALLQFKPDIVYVHNTWFKASVGIFDLLKDYQGKVFIKLNFGLSSNAEITISDLSGKVVLKQILNSSNSNKVYEINKTGINHGIYIFSLKYENTILNKKIVFE